MDFSRLTEGQRALWRERYGAGQAERLQGESKTEAEARLALEFVNLCDQRQMPLDPEVILQIFDQAARSI